jgi:hypothetical protein
VSVSIANDSQLNNGVVDSVDSATVKLDSFEFVRNVKDTRREEGYRGRGLLFRETGVSK